MLASHPLSTSTGQTVANVNACPHCHGHVVRVWRRPIDRFVSWFVPVQRYRCEVFACQWQGNFRTPAGSDGPATRHSGLPAGDAHRTVEPSSLIVPGMIVAAASLLITMAATADW